MIDYQVMSGAREGQMVSQFPTELLRKIKAGGLRPNPDEDSEAFMAAIEAQLVARAEAAMPKPEDVPVGATINPAPIDSKVQKTLPLPCGHPVSMLKERDTGSTVCAGCERLWELYSNIKKIIPRKADAVYDAVLAWERDHLLKNGIKP